MKRQPYDIIRRPIVTEKSTDLREEANQIVFEVAPDANKIEIKQAVEALFKVKVQQVRTIKVRGKKRRLGLSVGKRPDWKKAIVKLRPGDTIQVFEGV